MKITESKGTLFEKIKDRYWSHEKGAIVSAKRVDPQDALPYGPDFLLVDEAEVTVPGEKVRGSFLVDGEKPLIRMILDSHFPGEPVWPGVQIVEHMAQVALYLILADPEQKGKLPLFRGINKLTFSEPVTEGDTIITEVTFGEQRRGIFTGNAMAMVRGIRVAKGELRVVMQSIEGQKGDV